MEDRENDDPDYRIAAELLREQLLLIWTPIQSVLRFSVEMSFSHLFIYIISENYEYFNIILQIFCVVLFKIVLLGNINTLIRQLPAFWKEV